MQKRPQKVRKSMDKICASVAIESIERRLLMSTYTVNTLSDAVNPGPGLLTLRQAVADANANAGADTIVFSPKVFPSGSLHTITLTQGQIVFTDSTGATTVDGPGQSVLAINADQHSRVVKVSNGVTVNMNGLTLTGGSFNAPAGDLAAGGGVLDNGSLSLTDVTVSNSTSVGGSETGDVNMDGGPAQGGGIYSNGKLSLIGSMVSGDTALGGASTHGADGASQGGGIYSSGSLTITSSTISRNAANGGTNPNNPSFGGNASGGGIYTTGSFAMTDTNVSGNSANGGWCEQTEGGGGQGGAARGGSIFATGASTITGSTIMGNSAAAGYSDEGGSGIPSFAWGGAIFSTGSLTIASSNFSTNTVVGGARPLNDNGVGGNGYGGAIAAEGPLTITGSTLESNSAAGGSASELGTGPGSTQSSSGFGGAVYSTMSLLLVDSTVSGNLAQGQQFDDLYGSGGGYAQGGGLFTAGNATIEASSLTANVAEGGRGEGCENFLSPAGTGGAGQGAGLFNSGSLIVTNTTIAGNHAEGGTGGDGFPPEGGIGDSGDGGDGSGAGIYTTSKLAVFDSTISGNTANGGAPGVNGYAGGTPGIGFGAGIAVASGTATLANTTISGNIASGAANDITGSLATTSSHNLIGTGGGLTNGVNGNKIGIHNPQLMPLGWYGGPTETMPPLPGSPAIDAGSNALIPSGVTTDQRGDPRTIGKSVDIGSVEFGNVVIKGTVFDDETAGGKQTSSDPGIAGFTVYLDLNHDGVFDAGDESTVTNSAGQYSFDGLFAGSYSVGIVTQTNYRATTPTAQTVTANSGATITVPAFGETQDALISGTVINSTTGKPLSGWRVYVDLNDDGKWESTEPSVVTSSTGAWSFNIASPGTYEIRIVPMNGYKTAAPTGGFFSFAVGKASARIGNVFAEQAD